MQSNFFCPLYKAAADSQAWHHSEPANLGLIFDKFGDRWKWTEDKELLKFDPPGRNEDGNNWLHRLAEDAQKRQSPEAIKHFAMRQRSMVDRLGGQIVLLRNERRFVTGMGRQHPLENGFSWHHTLGVPYLSGSSVKGMLAAWCREETEDWDWKANRWTKDSVGSHWFGSQDRIGSVVFFDLIPVKPAKLTVDVMTPHYGDYYQNYQKGVVPGDWLSPNPIKFLTVDRQQTWQLGIALGPALRSSQNAPDLKAVIEFMLGAFEFLGVGAKTNIGMGRFTRDNQAEQQWILEEEKRRRQKEQTDQRAREQAEFEESLASDSEPLRVLRKKRREQKWVLLAGDNNMMTALEEFADMYPEPPEDCIEWIRELLESIPDYKGVWDEPEAMKGKSKKPKPRYKSARVRNLARRLNPKFH